MGPKSGVEWFERPSFVWPLEPGEEIYQCSYCGPFWRAAIERADDAPFGLLLREWHDESCPVYIEVLGRD